MEAPGREANIEKRVAYMVWLITRGTPSWEAEQRAMALWYCTPFQARKLKLMALQEILDAETRPDDATLRAELIAQLRAMQQLCVEHKDTKGAVAALKEISRLTGVAAPAKSDVKIQLGEGGQMAQNSEQQIKARIAEIVQKLPKITD